MKKPTMAPMSAMRNLEVDLLSGSCGGSGVARYNIHLFQKALIHPSCF